MEHSSELEFIFWDMYTSVWMTRYRWHRRAPQMGWLISYRQLICWASPSLVAQLVHVEELVDQISCSYVPFLQEPPRKEAGNSSSGISIQQLQSDKSFDEKLPPFHRDIAVYCQGSLPFETHPLFLLLLNQFRRLHLKVSLFIRYLFEALLAAFTLHVLSDL